jgi:phosphatidylethanolamine/phosphatidyl-N-methylethanolamine N-methyltransferase
MRINTPLWNKIRYTLYLPFYDLIAGPFDKQRKQSIEMLAPKTYENILILGAGSGLDLYHLKNCQNITAIDITPGMIGLLKARARAIEIPVDARVMDGQRLVFADNSFDCVILHLIVAVIPDPYQCLKEVERVLKPGGRAVIFDKFAPDNSKIGLLKKVINIFTNFMFTDITRKADDIINNTQLKKTNDVNALWNNVFRIIQLEKK